VVLLSVANAQERLRQRGLGGGLSALQLVQNEAVQKDIAVTDEQTAKLRELLAAYERDIAAVPQLSRQDAQKLPEAERRAKMQEARDARTKAEDAHQKKLTEILEKAQLERLDQIRLQAQGPEGISDPAVATALGLTREDRQKIRTALAELNQGRQRGERPTEEQRTAQREKVEAKLKELLSKEQLDKLQELRGKPFDVSQLRAGRRRQAS
jgi:hypothetical protein